MVDGEGGGAGKIVANQGRQTLFLGRDGRPRVQERVQVKGEKLEGVSQAGNKNMTGWKNGRRGTPSLIASGEKMKSRPKVKERETGPPE